MRGQPPRLSVAREGDSGVLKAHSNREGHEFTRADERHKMNAL